MRLLVFVLLVNGCGPGPDPSGAANGLTVRFTFDGGPAEYRKGFTGFLAFEIEGAVEVPVRYEQSPRKGFMDRSKLVWRAQYPEFAIVPELEFTFRPKPKAQALLVGHHDSQDSSRWYVQRFAIDQIERDTNKDYVMTIKVSDLGPDKVLVPQATADTALRALAATTRSTEAIRNKEP